MYKNYKQLFETIKKVHFSNLITQYKYNIKKTWALIREAIGTEEMKQNFPKNICIGNKEITDLKTIAEKFSKCFTEIGPSLAKNTDLSSVIFDSYLKLLMQINKNII